MSHNIQLCGARQILTVWPSHHIGELIATIESGLLDESDKAIDASKALIEAVCKTILNERGRTIDKTESPGTLFRKTTQVLNMTQEAGGAQLQTMLRGMTGAIDGLEQLRDRFGPFCHGRDAEHITLNDCHRLMAARTAETIVVLLFEAHCALNVNLHYSRKPFDQSSPVNEALDKVTDITIDQDSCEIVINNAYRFRPSQILYCLEREGYIDELTKLTEAQVSGACTPTAVKSLRPHRVLTEKT